MKIKYAIFVLGFLLLIFVSMHFVDAQLAQFLIPDPFGIQNVAQILTVVGEGWPYFVLCGVGAAFARLKSFKGRNIWFNRLLFGFLSLCVSGFMVSLIKFLVGRQRPFFSEGKEALVFSPLSHHWNFHSFPSGHAQTCFTVAGVLSIWFPKSVWLWISLAVFFTLTRPALGVHFLSDVLMGAMVGYLGVQIAKHIWSRLQKKYPQLDAI